MRLSKKIKVDSLFFRSPDNQFIRFYFLITCISTCTLFACQQTVKEKPVVKTEPSKQIVTPPDTFKDVEEDYVAWLESQGHFEDTTKLYPTYKNQVTNYDTLWRKITAGLNWLSLDAPKKCGIGDSKITVLQINPNKFQLELLSTGATNELSKTAEEWSLEKDLIAVFNAGMFQRDGKTSTGLFKHYNYINNGKLNPKYKSIFAFNPKTNDIPSAKLIDLDCDNWEDWKDKYHSYTQGIRMISCQGKNVWSAQKKYWSMISVATDKAENVLFCFTRSPYSVSDFNKMLLTMPLDIQRMMYLEGGPEASFYIDYNSIQIKKMGSYETGFNENNDNQQFWGIPNVIGVKRID